MVTENALDLIRQNEGLSLKLYNCPAGDCTIGYGHKVHIGPINGSPTESPYKNGITKEQAENLLFADADMIADRVKKFAPRANQNQIDALTSFAYNLGLHALADSTLLQKLIHGDAEGAAAEFDRWIYVNHKPSKGLMLRRAQEKALFLKPDDDFNPAGL